MGGVAARCKGRGVGRRGESDPMWGVRGDKEEEENNNV